MTTTKHNHGPNFGRHEPGCPRCIELSNGSAPVVWRNSRRDDERAVQAIHDHFRSEKHRSGGCGPVCTFGDW